MMIKIKGVILISNHAAGEYIVEDPVKKLFERIVLGLM